MTLLKSQHFKAKSHSILKLEFTKVSDEIPLFFKQQYEVGEIPRIQFLNHTFKIVTWQLLLQKQRKKGTERNEMMEATQRMRKPIWNGFHFIYLPSDFKSSVCNVHKSFYMNIIHFQLHASLLWLIKLVSVFSTC